MQYYEVVKEKLKTFIRKYYINLIIKGSILFFGIGLLYLLLITTIEHFFWLTTSGRQILFILFLLVEFLLLIKFIGIPGIKLLNLTRGLTEVEAAKIIGEHFPEVGDKLLNLLQLKKETVSSELLVAGIDQKSRELNPVPFSAAIDFKSNLKFLKLLAFPILIILGLFIAGKTDVIFNSLNRISDYNTVYLKPAPFQFIISSDSLRVREGDDFRVKIRTEGDYFPESVRLNLGKESVFMKRMEPGSFEYNFKNVKESQTFTIEANEVESAAYTLEMLPVPKIMNFSLSMDYPDYTGQNDDKITGTGNITVPEGTKIHWNFKTRNLSRIQLRTLDSTVTITATANRANYTKRILTDFPYTLSGFNEHIADFQPMDYRVRVVKDQYPKISITSMQDSLDTEVQYFKGEVSDDYGLRQLEIVYYVENELDNKNKSVIPIVKSNYDEFYFTFPGKLELEPGATYMYFFRIFDNDAVNGTKSSSSQVFSFRKSTEGEKINKNLEEQKQTVRDLEKSIEEFKLRDTELNELWKLDKEKGELNYNERRKLEEFLKRQKQQNTLMRNYSKKLERSLPQDKQPRSKMEEELTKRLEGNEKRLEENEELLKELEEYANKIQEEELGKKLDKLSKQNKANQRNLEQLLELTKKYYVEEKKRKLGKDLEKLAEEQEKLSDREEDNNVEQQKKLTDEFEKLQQELDDLEKENNELKKPKDLNRDENLEDEIGKNQKAAEEELKNENKESAKKKQKQAAEDMKEMSKRMQKGSEMQQMEQLEADAESLRQILDNLLVFSFQQENLLEEFRRIRQENPVFARKLKEQGNLRENFQHIDDSLFSLGLRNPMINEKITSHLIDIDFDLNKSLERLSNNEIPQGTSSQQYVITNTNELANMLSKVLASMQNMMAMPSPGEGEGEEFQLGDIIKKQKQLIEKIKEGKGKPKLQENGMNTNPSEEDAGELFEIYKEQQMLRMQMEQMLKENGMKDNDGALREMNKIEEEILDKGKDPSTLERMQNLEYKLMEYEKAIQRQGMDEKRKSETNLKEYRNGIENQINSAKEYFNSTEILNRQILPLRQIYKEKVKEYFGEGSN